MNAVSWTRLLRIIRPWRPCRRAGATVLWGPYEGKTLDSAIVQFPGGYVAEIHQGR
jgi:hypothetical protein